MLPIRLARYGVRAVAASCKRINIGSVSQVLLSGFPKSRNPLNLFVYLTKSAHENSHLTNGHSFRDLVLNGQKN